MSFGTGAASSGGFGFGTGAASSGGFGFGTQSSLFGGSSAPDSKPPMFSSAPTFGSTPGFGATAQSAPGTSFGAAPTPFSVPSSSPNLFGAPPPSQASPFGASSGSLFGAPPTSAAPVFGKPSTAVPPAFGAQPASTASVFSLSVAPVTSAAPPATSFTFSGDPSSAPAQTLFDAKPPASSAAPAFSLNTQQATGTGFQFSSISSAASGQPPPPLGFSAPVTSLSTAASLFQTRGNSADPSGSGNAPTLDLATVPSHKPEIAATSFSAAPVTTTVSSQPASSPNLFGAASIGFGAGSSSGFGAITATTASTAPSVSFASPVTTAASAASAAPSLFSGLSSGASSSKALGASEGKQASTGLGLGTLAAPPAPSTQLPTSGGVSLGTASVVDNASAAPSTGFGFGYTSGTAADTSKGAGAVDTSGAKKSDGSIAGQSTSGALTGFSFESGAASSSAAVASASTGVIAATAAATVQATTTSLDVPSDIKDLSLDEVVNKWTEEVEELAQQFQNGAKTVSKWDRAIIANEDKINSLHRDAQSLQIGHKELSDNLDVILSQQSELHSLLDSLETDVERKIGPSPSKQGMNGSMSGISKMKGDVEREAMHRLSIEVTEELDAMALTIRDLVVELNKGGDTSADRSGDTASQIISVLNAHLDSLQYLDETSSALHKRLTDVHRTCEIATRESERMYGRRAAGLY